MSIIYKIVNTYNNFVYIGSTDRDFEVRKKEHIRYLKSNTHHCCKLQIDYNTFGIDRFKYYILEEVDIKDKYNREEWYIKKYIMTCYNTKLVPHRVDLSKESKDKMSASLRKFSRDEFVEVLYNLIYCPEISSSDILKYSKITPGILRATISGENNNSLINNDEHLKKLVSLYKKTKRYNKGAMSGMLLKNNVSDKVVKIDKSINSFCKDYNLDVSAISRVISGERKSHKGWKLLKKDE